MYWIESFDSGAAVGIMPRPRGGDWLEDEIRKLKVDGVQVIVSLLERSEVQQLGLNNEEATCRKHQIEFINFSIVDRDVPSDQSATNDLVSVLKKNILDGRKTVIHCRMGIGRSTIIAGVILLEFEMSVEQIINKIREIRKIEVPDTEEQTQWLRQQEMLRKNAK